ncbi:hypothetical protein PIB30_030300 [Stylosanthes scabra]|uniref:Uncharacterized protein n=1 Tax=Stylosanthes scabra TaxID=79078 RepID=A0ABU6RC01_9FABA|nr:hypothetical protein [Stylosanthes scabra]
MDVKRRNSDSRFYEAPQLPFKGLGHLWVPRRNSAYRFVVVADFFYAADSEALNRYHPNIGAVCGDTHSELAMTDHQTKVTNTNPPPEIGRGHIPPKTPKQHRNIGGRKMNDDQEASVTPEMRTRTLTLSNYSEALHKEGPLPFKKQSEGDKGVSPSATVDLTEETPVAPEQVEPEKSEGRVSSPEATSEPSPLQKKRRVQKEVAEESSNSLILLERGLDPVPVIDQYFMTSETKKALGDLEADDRLVRVQRMLLLVIVHCRDVQRENAGAPSLRSLLSEKNKKTSPLAPGLLSWKQRGSPEMLRSIGWKGWKEFLMRKPKSLKMRNEPLRRGNELLRRKPKKTWLPWRR